MTGRGDFIAIDRSVIIVCAFTMVAFAAGVATEVRRFQESLWKLLLNNSQTHDKKKAINNNNNNNKSMFASCA